MHKQRLIAIVPLLLALAAPEARAGIEPSPFKRKELAAVVARVAARLDGVNRWRDVSGDVRQRFAAIQQRLVALEATVERTRDLRLVGNSIGILDSVSAVMFNPQPDPPGVQATLNVLDRLSWVAFNPQPDPPGDVLRAIGIMDRISEVAFNPQPDPPGRTAGIQILDRISALAFNPQPDPPVVIGRVLDLFEHVAAVMFNPQPDPPGIGTLNQLVDTISLMRDLAAVR